MTTLSIEPIGVIHSPYKEKFAVPRQPGLVQDGGGELRLLPPYNQPEAVRGLEQFSHIWVLFIFHQTQGRDWHPTVRPPRLGGNTRMGVFATRSTFRPNPIGMSLIELKGIRQQGNDIILELGSLDLVDGTPVIDIKPYLPFAESIPDARAGFAQNAPDAAMPIIFSSQAEQTVQQESDIYPQLRRFIIQVLAQDPRPAYRQKEQQARDFAVYLLEFNVHWRVENGQAEVISIVRR